MALSQQAHDGFGPLAVLAFEIVARGHASSKRAALFHMGKHLSNPLAESLRAASAAHRFVLSKKQPVHGSGRK
jgi:hypothetical protein